MCFRKSFVAMPTDQVQTGTCPSCGMPVAASIGIDSGICPHCGKPIVKESAILDNPVNPQKIL